jgi:hypothetical protein
VAVAEVPEVAGVTVAEAAQAEAAAEAPGEVAGATRAAA